MIDLVGKLMNARSRSRSALALGALLAVALAACSPSGDKTATTDSTAATETSVDYCALVSDAELAKLYRKKLYPTAEDNGCMWSETQGGMADLEFNVRQSSQDLRKYFNADLPSNVKLVKITDLGDDGLMSVGDGTLGVIVVRKGDRVLESAATFLDIEPGSDKQKTLWQIYARALAQ